MLYSRRIRASSESSAAGSVIEVRWGQSPFGAQVILNGHEYVACAGRKAGLGLAKEGNCFTRVSDPERLAQIADTLSQPGTIGRLSQVIDQWIYTGCLCFGLGLDEQKQSGFVYQYSIYQVEYSRNLLFASGAVMDRLFNTVVDRTRSRLDIRKVRTLFGSKGRPHDGQVPLRFLDYDGLSGR